MFWFVVALTGLVFFVIGFFFGAGKVLKVAQADLALAERRIKSAEADVSRLLCGQGMTFNPPQSAGLATAATALDAGKDHITAAEVLDRAARVPVDH